MTEDEYQQLKIRLKKANILNGRISRAKKTVIQWTGVEARVGLIKKDWAKRGILIAITKLNTLKKEFAEL